MTVHGINEKIAMKIKNNFKMKNLINIITLLRIILAPVIYIINFI